jgi:hypothetical protein
VVGSQIVFSGTPTETGGFSWSAAVYDKALQHSSATLILTTQIFDTSVTAPSTVPPKPENYYYYGTDHCCVLKAVLSSGHARSGSPSGTVSFFVDGVAEGTAPLSFQYTTVPAPTTATVQSTNTIEAGAHSLKAVYHTDPPPAGVCWPNYQGMTKNCFTASSGTTSFTVAPSPTLTTLSAPGRTAAGELQFSVQVTNDTAKTGGFAQVDPGTTVELLMDGTVVDSVRVPLVSQPMPDFVLRPPAGNHTFVAKYLGDHNELLSLSPPVPFGASGAYTVPTTTTQAPPPCAGAANPDPGNITHTTLARAAVRSLAEDQQPQPAPDDPAGGIDVAGGKVHRGKAPYQGDATRPAFYLWYEPPADAGCKRFEWYQFVKETATLTSSKFPSSRFPTGKDVTDVLGAQEGRYLEAPELMQTNNNPAAIELPKNGSKITFGKWSADDYPLIDNNTITANKMAIIDHKPDRIVFVPPNVLMCDMTNGPSGGRYKPSPIPGVTGITGVEDAPQYGRGGAFGTLFRRLAEHSGNLLGLPGLRLHENKDKPEGPPTETYTLVITYLFRDCLYLIDKDTPANNKPLGYSELTDTETLVFKNKWVKYGENEDYWFAYPGDVVTDTFTIKFGDWTPLPKGPRIATGGGK